MNTEIFASDLTLELAVEAWILAYPQAGQIFGVASLQHTWKWYSPNHQYGSGKPLVCIEKHI